MAVNGEWRRGISHAEPHGCGETRGTRCDGCAELSCIEQGWARHRRWRFYCGALARRVDPSAVGIRECPLRRRKPRGRA